MSYEGNKKYKFKFEDKAFNFFYRKTKYLFLDFFLIIQCRKIGLAQTKIYFPWKR